MANMSPALSEKLSSHVASRNLAVQENVHMQVSDLTKAVKLMASTLHASGGIKSFDSSLAMSLVQSRILSNPAMNIRDYAGDVVINSKGGDQIDFHLALLKYSVNSTSQGISSTSSDGIEYIQEGKMTAEDGSVHVGKFSLSEISRKPYLSEGTIYFPDGSKHEGKMAFHESLGKALLSDGTITNSDGGVITLRTVRDDSSKTLTAFVTRQDGKVTKVVSYLDKKTNTVEGTVTKSNGQSSSIRSFFKLEPSTSDTTVKSDGPIPALDRKVSEPPIRRPDAEPANLAEAFSLKAPRRPQKTNTPNVLTVFDGLQSAQRTPPSGNTRPSFSSVTQVINQSGAAPAQPGVSRSTSTPLPRFQTKTGTPETNTENNTENNNERTSGADTQNNTRPEKRKRGGFIGRAFTGLVKGVVAIVPERGTVRVPAKIRAEIKSLLNSVAVKAEGLPHGDRKTAVTEQLKIAAEKWAAIGSSRLKFADYTRNVSELNAALIDCKTKLLNASHPDKSDDKQRHDEVMNFAQKDLKQGTTKIISLLEKRVPR
jgi:hypothetical protein